nr:SMP-30/gluconolactonase/LRE family protein [Ktedonobacteraceae bacterium]
MPEVHTLLTGLAFGESPRWHQDRLWFADWGTQEVIAVELDGKSEVIVRVPTARPETRLNFGGAGQGPFSIDWLPDGRLLIVSGRDRLLLRREPDGRLVTHADLTSLSDHGWNEIVVDGRGHIYLNGGGSDFVAGEPFAPSIVALVTLDGSARQVADGLALPNGMAVTPDNSTLIVAESYGKRLTAFDIGPDGSLSNRRVWADLGDGVPDGICLDTDWAVWYGDVPNQRCVRVREGGEVLQTIPLDRGCFACMLGGVNKQTLFLVATEWRGAANVAALAGTGQVLTAGAPAPHAGWP